MISLPILSFLFNFVHLFLFRSFVHSGQESQKRWLHKVVRIDWQRDANFWKLLFFQPTQQLDHEVRRKSRKLFLTKIIPSEGKSET